MSFFNDLQHGSSPRSTSSNILGATALSRRALAQVIAEIGLFGQDSSLGQTDQAVVQSVIGPLPGVSKIPQAVERHSGRRCQVVAELTRDAIAGGGSASHAARVTAANVGLAPQQVREIERVVAKVASVFGLQASIDLGGACANDSRALAA